MGPISTRIVPTRMIRNSILKNSAISPAGINSVMSKPPVSLRKITPVHKSIIQIMPKRNVANIKVAASMKRVGSNVTSKPTFKAIKPSTLRSPIQPRVAKKKLILIKPTQKPVGRHMELTMRRLKQLHGHDSEFGPIYGEFAGASSKFNPFAIHSGASTAMSVPVDRELEDPAKSARLFISGIPAWLDPVKVYYDLLVYLAQHHLMLSTLDFTSHADEGQAAWANVTLSLEAELLLEKASNHLSFPVHQVFSIPNSIKVSPSELSVTVVEDLHNSCLNLASDVNIINTP